MRLVAASALSVVALAGCAGVVGFERPDVNLVDLRFTDLTVFETSGVMTVRITNPNPDPIVIEGGSYRLYLNGLKVGTALSSRRVEIPRLGSRVEDAELSINNLALATRLATMLDQPELQYRLKTRLYLEGVFGTRRLNSVYEGRLSLDDAGRPEADRLVAPPEPEGAR